MAGKVFLACALGGGIGALVALQMWQPFWWLGLLVGFLVCYLAYDFRAVIRAVPRAWAMATTSEMRRYYGEAFQFGFRAVGSMVATGSNVFILFLLFVWLVPPTDPNVGHGLLVVFTAVSLLCGAVWDMLYLDWLSTYRREAYLSKRTDEWLADLIKWHNPLVFYCYQVPRGIWWAARRTPTTVMTGAIVMGRFAKYLFLLIHSEIRLLCAFDAAAGAAVGYFLGSALIGALAGGVFGVLNFELISKLWLHLVPSRSR